MRARAVVREKAILSWICLFEGQRWSAVEYVAIAVSAEGDFLGLASLSPTSEERTGGPHIVGVWVIQERRRQKIGLALLEACAEHSQQCWGQKPTVIGVSPAGAALVQKAQSQLPINGSWLPGPVLP